ncbi:MAG: cytochrome c [Saprospiraceae bacterium]|nr:cytochrome c [Saprospiraceae bacterium]
MVGFVLFIQCSNSKPSRGQALYETHCGNCHLNNGQGIGTLMPPLKNADYILENRADLACIITNGLEGEIEVNEITYNNPMLPITELSEVDIVNILNYIQAQWYPQESVFSISEIKDQLENCN